MPPSHQSAPGIFHRSFVCVTFFLAMAMAASSLPAQDTPIFRIDTKLVNLWPASRLDELMPWAWAAERSASRQAA